MLYIGYFLSQQQESWHGFMWIAIITQWDRPLAKVPLMTWYEWKIASHTIINAIISTVVY